MRFVATWSSPTRLGVAHQMIVMVDVSVRMLIVEYANDFLFADSKRKYKYGSLPISFFLLLLKTLFL